MMFLSSFLLFTLNTYVLCSDKIVGGCDAEEGAYPYQVALVMGKSLQCGGSIIGKYWILTAAHCLERIKPDQMKVVVGTTVLNNESGQQYDIQEFKIHENYDEVDVRNDIALIKLKKSITFNNNISSISLAKEAIGGGKSLILTGWGKTQYPGTSTKKLQKIRLVSVSDSDCAKRYGRLVDQRNLCTEGIPGRGACLGDSGGPLVFNGTQVGIVSFGVACATGIPDVFTKVSSFGKWIAEHMK